MKTFKVKLADGEEMKFQGARMTRDGSAVQIYDEEDNVIVAFKVEEVARVFEIQPQQD